MSRIKNVMLVQPRSTGGNFEYVAIFRQGMLFISAALAAWKGEYTYSREIWFEDRSGKIDPVKDLEGVDLLLITALINEVPRAYEIARQAKLANPKLKIIGGGPHLGPLPGEALREGLIDVVVQREGEDVIGQLADVVLSYDGADLKRELAKIGGIAFYDENGCLVQTPARRIIHSDFVELPDYDSIRDLTPENPMAAGVLETVRGCTENCSFCEVIKQFLGYRMIKRETEIKRLLQLQDLASRGLIYRSPLNGKFAVFVSDDLHSPPMQARKFRLERLERARTWQNYTEGMFMISQNRAELGSDPEVAEAFRKMGMDMLYIGVESSNAENLKLIRKRQEPDQLHRDLAALNEQFGFTVVAMTIIGLDYDTEESVMEMADWVRTVSRYQTANLLTPLPATHNWTALTPIDAEGKPMVVDADGNTLPGHPLRPYILYTGRQFVHVDTQPRNWTLEKSREVYNRYTAKLRPVDKLYERIFHRMKVDAAKGRLVTGVPTRVA